MRITKFDRLFDAYTYTTALTADGMEQRAYVKAISSMAGDLQPIGGKFNPAEYGIDSIPSNVKRLFFDSNVALALGQIVKDQASGVAYMVKGLAAWYTHQEAVLEPYDVVLP
jgi:hypothetical protein